MEDIYSEIEEEDLGREIPKFLEMQRNHEKMS